MDCPLVVTMNGMHAQTGQLLAANAHLAQSVADILTTPLGSRVMRREYGSLVPELIDQPAHSRIQVRLFAAIALALMRWEPRITVHHIALIPLTRPGQYQLELTLTQRLALSARQTLALPLSFSSLTEFSHD